VKIKLEENEIVTKYKGYCSVCYHTIWKNEIVVKAGARGFTHKSCLAALADRTPRRLNPKVEHVIGQLDKGILKKKAKKLLLASQ
jgi:hypothetical protein